MYAIIADRNRQFKAEIGQKLTLDRHNELEAGATLELPVLLLADGSTTKIGSPFVAGSKAVVKVIEHSLGEKGIAGKFKRRKASRRRVGYRHQHTVVEVVSIA